MISPEKRANFTDALQFLRTITLLKLWNGFLLRFSYLISKNTGYFVHWGKPESLSIEPTNLCNLKCPECPSGNNTMQRARMFLSKEAYFNTIEQSYKHVTSLQLYFQGEPFLHPSIFDFIKFSHQHRIYTSTSTNGQFLTHDNCIKIIESGLHRLIISLDGITQEVYEKYRVGGSLETVISGIKTLVDLKKEKRSKTPYLVIQFVVFKTNEHQMESLKQLAKEWKVNALKFKSAQLEDFENGNELMPINNKYNRYRKDENGTFSLKRNPNFKCRRIWNGSVVSANNELLPCCFDKNASHSYGNLKKDSLSVLFRSQEANSFRKQVWMKNRQPEMCKNCTEGLKQTWF
jgi:radical SAM protein with 4Fe4S-binding SPASM domain